MPPTTGVIGVREMQPEDIDTVIELSLRAWEPVS